jgi:hypothetical protein
VIRTVNHNSQYISQSTQWTKVFKKKNDWRSGRRTQMGKKGGISIPKRDRE